VLVVRSFCREISVHEEACRSTSYANEFWAADIFKCYSLRGRHCHISAAQKFFLRLQYLLFPPPAAVRENTQNTWQQSPFIWVEVGQICIFRYNEFLKAEGRILAKMPSFNFSSSLDSVLPTVGIRNNS
jgi:hypothetical protein